MPSLSSFDSSRFDSSLPADTTRVILIRHGRSTFNQLKLYQGSSDASVLTEAGHETARQVGKFLSGQTIDAIYTSPLKRVQQTVDAILEQLGSQFPKRLAIHSNLREIDMAAWEGRSFQEVQQSEPAAYQCWKQRPHEFQLGMPAAYKTSGGTGAVAVAVQTQSYPVLDLYDRVQQFWQEVLPRHRGKTIVIASHGGTNCALISTALGLSPARFHSLQQSNCGISVLNFPEGCLTAGQLKTLNLTTPIGEILPKLKAGKQGLRLLLCPAESTHQSSHLAELLQNVPIDFSLTSLSDSVQALTDQILQNHPQTVQLQSQQQQFLLNWQRTIAAKSNAPTASNASSLVTGLVVAQIPDIQQVLAQVIGLTPDQQWKLQVQPGAISILHYPTGHQAAVVQAFNFA